MRKITYLSIVSTLAVATILCCSFLSVAQNREKFVISAKAGGINAVTGQAKVHSRGETEWQDLMVTDDLNSGDHVQTASDGRVEILLNPGSYLRVGGDSEVELANNALENIEVRLLRGTAIVEATGGDGTELMINISTPHTKMSIVRDGLYRLNVVPENATELIVRKGRVILNDSHTKIKSGNKVIFSASNVMVAKLTKEEKKNKDEVETWSKDRAQSLAKANRKITDRMINSAFASFRDPRLFGFRSSGLWIYDTRFGCYTFLPFGWGWGSPYGGSYSTAVVTGYYGGPVITRNANSGWSNNGSVTAPGTTSAGSTGFGGGAAAGSRPATSSPAASMPIRESNTGARERKIDMLSEPRRP